MKKATTRTAKVSTSKTQQASKLQEILSLMGVTENDAKNLIIKQATTELLAGLLSQTVSDDNQSTIQKFDFTTQVSEEINKQISSKVNDLIRSYIANALVEVCIRETNKFGEPIDPAKPPMTLAELIESRTDKYMRRKVNKTTGKPSGAVEQKLTNKLSKDVVNHVREVIEQNMLSEK